jgi:hypothetical protein
MIMDKKITALKWTATAVLIVGAAVNGLGYWPLGPLLLVSGGLIWMVVAMMVRDTPLVVTNAVMSVVALLAIIWTMHTLDAAPPGSAKADEYWENQCEVDK